MKALSDEAEALVAGLAESVERAPTLGAAVSDMAGALGGRYPVVRVSVRTLVAPETLEIVGVWSRHETELGVGVRMPARASSLSEPAVRAGRASVLSFARHAHLLDQILIDEGIRSWVSVALLREGEPAGLLAVSADRDAAFLEADAPLFEAIARATEKRLLSLAPSSGTLGR